MPRPFQSLAPLGSTLFLFLALLVISSSSFLLTSSRSSVVGSRERNASFPLCGIVRSSSKGRNEDEREKKKKKKGYQFGDISRSLAQKFTSSVKDLTGKDDYEFGDLSRWVDARVKDKVNDVTGKDNYEFGDLSRWADARAKEKAMEFTNKTDYEVGDVSKEILRKVSSGDYKIEDVLLLCRVLFTLGVGLSPVAASLPGRVLVEMLDVSLAQELGGRFVGAVTLELDRRMKRAVTGDSGYELGDLTKKAFLKFIDKDEYQFGDITKTVMERMENDNAAGSSMSQENGGKVVKTFAESASASAGAGSSTIKEAKFVQQNQNDPQEFVDVLDLDPKILEELLEWDKAMIEQDAKQARNAT